MTECSGARPMPPAMNSRSLPANAVSTGKRVAVGATDSDLLADAPWRGAIRLRSRTFLMENSTYSSSSWATGRDGEQRLADAGNREHGALAGDMVEGLFAVKAYNAERLDVRRIDADIGDDADDRGSADRFSLRVPPPSVLMTLTMFIWIGTLWQDTGRSRRSRRHPSLLSGK